MLLQFYADANAYVSVATKTLSTSMLSNNLIEKERLPWPIFQ
ncbi:hypothetical protein EMIT074MI3_12490 [Bacillus licheniformis]